MKIYVGQAGSKRILKEVSDRQLGRMHTAYDWKNPRIGFPWALDNGAYSYWTRGLPFDGPRFERCLRKVRPELRPDFGIIPDIVAGGLHSLLFSLAWLPRLPHGWPWYFAVQDGMKTQDLEPYITLFGGLFVGGTLEWKLDTAKEWVAYAHKNGLPCHIGRVGTTERYLWADEIGADSVDSVTPVIARGSKIGRDDKLHYIDSYRAQTKLPREQVLAVNP